MTIAWVYLVNGLAFVLYGTTVWLVGRERRRSGILAPATSGDIMLERAFRVQQNTLEQLVVFVPASLLFAVLVNVTLATLLGAVWLVARGFYIQLYMHEPASRAPGFIGALIPQVILILGVVLGAIWAILRG